MTTPLTFLGSDGDLTAARKLLIIQTGPDELLVELIERVRETYPQAALSVLLQRGVAEAKAPLPEPGAVEYLENKGSKSELTRRLQARGFDGVFVLYSNHPGYWKLKLLPFALGARAVLVVNEHLGWFPVTIRDADRLVGHALWRLNSGSVSLQGPVRGLARAAAAPAVLGYLLAYERLVQRRTGEAAAGWKRLGSGGDQP